MDSSWIWLWPPHVVRLPRIHSHFSQHPSIPCYVLGLVSCQRSLKERIFLFSVPVQTGWGMCPKPCKEMGEGFRPSSLEASEQKILTVREIVSLILPSRFASLSPCSQTWFYSLPIPNLLPADFLHLTLARVIFLLSPLQAAIYVRSLLEMWADSHQTVVCQSGLPVALGENFSSNTPIPLNRKENFVGRQDFIDLYPNKNTPALPFFYFPYQSQRWTSS